MALGWMYCTNCAGFDLISHYNGKGETMICKRCHSHDDILYFDGTYFEFMRFEKRKEIENAYFERLHYNREMSNYLFGNKY